MSSDGSIRPFVYPDEQPHPEYVENHVNITHIMLIDVEICEPIEKTVNVKACSRILNGSGVTNQLAVIVGFGHVDDTLFRVSGQVYLMKA